MPRSYMGSAQIGTGQSTFGLNVGTYNNGPCCDPGKLLVASIFMAIVSIIYLGVAYSAYSTHTFKDFIWPGGLFALAIISAIWAGLIFVYNNPEKYMTVPMMQPMMVTQPIVITQPPASSATPPAAPPDPKKITPPPAP